MSQLELLVSAPGTGKTAFCVERFREEIEKSRSGIDSRSFFVLPNREHAGRIQNLLLKKGVSGFFNAHVVTIHDLAARFAAGPGRRPGDAVRRSVIRSILETPAGESVPLEAFAAVRDLKGFQEALVQCVKEFKAELLSIADFEKIAQPLRKDEWFRARFRDLSVVLKQYEAKLSALGFREPEDDIAMLERSQAESMELVIFDGFYHFTRAQAALVEWAAARASKTLVTLTISDEAGRSDVFVYPSKTRARLRRAGFREAKAPLEPRRAETPALRHLEKYLFRKGKAPAGAAESLEILRARDAREEMVRIAREIRKLHREEDFHWSDICVIFRDLSGYQKILESVFREFEIGAHVHERERLVETGYGICVRRVLRLFLEGWKRDDLLHLARSGYFTEFAPNASAAEMEHAAAERTLFEGRPAWLDLAGALSAPSGAFIESFAALESELLSASGPSELSRCFRKFLLRLNLSAEDAPAAEAVEELLRGAALSFGADAGFSFGEFARRLLDSLESGLYSAPPQGRNRVQVYDAVMALPKEYKAVFVAGLVDGRFPKEFSEDPVLSDDERRAMNAAFGSEVFEERRQRLSGEKYFFYMAVTRARRRLYLSYPDTDGEGKPVLASFFVEEVRRCFPGAALDRAPLSGLDARGEWESAKEARLAAVEAWFRRRAPAEKPDPRPEMLAALAAGPALAGVLRWKDGPPRARLDDPRFFEELAVRQGFSPTALEKFADCPFQYFAEKVLALEDPLDFQMPRIRGGVFHQTIQSFFETLERSKLRVSDAGAPELRRRLTEELEAQFNKSPLAREAPYRRAAILAGMKERLEWFLEEEMELSRARALRPAHFEKGFGFSRGEKPADYPFLILEKGISIGGFIDRIDISEDGRALLVDYKSSSTGLKKKIRRGFELQLPLYWLAVEKHMGLQVVGIEHRHFKLREEFEGFYRAEARGLLGFGPKKEMAGEGEVRELLERASAAAVEKIARLREGDISARPASEAVCKNCDFSAVCRFEKWKAIYGRP